MAFATPLGISHGHNPERSAEAAVPARRLSDRTLRWSMVAFGVAASAYLATQI